MSEPGPVVENLPRVFFKNMTGTSSKGRGGEIAAQPTPPNSLTEASEAPAGNQDTEVNGCSTIRTSTGASRNASFCREWIEKSIVSGKRSQTKCF